MEFKPKSKKLTITSIDGESFEIRCPSIGELEDITEQIEKDGPRSAVGHYVRFFAALGLPEKVARSFDPDDFHDLVTFVLTPKKKSVP